MKIMKYYLILATCAVSLVAAQKQDLSYSHQSNKAFQKKIFKTIKAALILPPSLLFLTQGVSVTFDSIGADSVKNMALGLFGSLPLLATGAYGCYSCLP